MALCQSLFLQRIATILRSYAMKKTWSRKKMINRWFSIQIKFVHIPSLHFPALVILPRASGHVKFEQNKSAQNSCCEVAAHYSHPLLWPPNRTSHLRCRQKSQWLGDNPTCHSKKPFQLLNTKAAKKMHVSMFLFPQLWSLTDSLHSIHLHSKRQKKKAPRRFEANLWSGQGLRVPSLESIEVQWKSSLPPYRQSQATTSLHAPDGKHHHDLEKNIRHQIPMVATGKRKLKSSGLPIVNITWQMMQDLYSTIFNPMVEQTHLHHPHYLWTPFTRRKTFREAC